MSNSTTTMTTWSHSPCTLISRSITMEANNPHLSNRYSSFSNRWDICPLGVWGVEVRWCPLLRWACTQPCQGNRWMTEIDIWPRFRWLHINNSRCLRELRSRNRIKGSHQKTNSFISTWMLSTQTASTMDIQALWQEAPETRSTHLAKWWVSWNFTIRRREPAFKRS